MNTDRTGTCVLNAVDLCWTGAMAKADQSVTSVSRQREVSPSNRAEQDAALQFAAGAHAWIVAHINR
jgi:hypothetical protein